MKYYKYYTGIGSRQTPKHILELCCNVATRLEQDGWILRSGGAVGADKAFEMGVRLKENKEIYLATGKISSQAWASVDVFHPYPKALKPYARALMARNYHQITGKNEDSKLSSFVICWTPDGCKSGVTRSIKTGGTGQAISIASSLGIPVFNLANPEDRDKIERYLSS